MALKNVGGSNLDPSRFFIVVFPASLTSDCRSINTVISPDFIAMLIVRFPADQDSYLNASV